MVTNSTEFIYNNELYGSGQFNQNQNTTSNNNLLNANDESSNDDY